MLSQRDKIYLENALRDIGDAIVGDAREFTVFGYNNLDFDWPAEDLIDRMVRRTIAAVEGLATRQDAQDAKKTERLEA